MLDKGQLEQGAFVFEVVETVATRQRSLLEFDDILNIGVKEVKDIGFILPEPRPKSHGPWRENRGRGWVRRGRPF